MPKLAICVYKNPNELNRLSIFILRRYLLHKQLRIVESKWFPTDPKAGIFFANYELTIDENQLPACGGPQS
jgi:hypothetical protein